MIYVDDHAPLVLLDLLEKRWLIDRCPVKSFFEVRPQRNLLVDGTN